MGEVTWVQKATVGALGGLALALLKLIEARFFIDAFSSVEAHAAYLTYFAYMLLGSLAAVFLSDHELPDRKIVRSAFVIGILAPSVLLAIANQPIRPSSHAPDLGKSIPKLSSFPFSAAHAGEQSHKAIPDSGGGDVGGGDAGPINVVPKAALGPSYVDAIKAALGRKELVEKYVYVVGSTPDKNKAVETATLANALFGQGAKSPDLKSNVIQIQGQPGYYVTIGGFVDREGALSIKAESTAVATKFLAVQPSDMSVKFPEIERRRIALLLANAPVVSTKTLLNP